MKLSRRSLAAMATATPLFINGSVRAQTSTESDVTLASAKDAFNGLARFIPEDDSGEMLNLYWTNFQRQLFAIRRHANELVEDEDDTDILMPSIYAGGPDFLMNAFYLPDIAGYQLGDIIQAAQLGTAPETSTLVHLHTDLDSLIPVWESLEYEERDNDYGTFWTIGDEYQVNLQHPVQQKVMARFNNVAMLPQNVLAYSSSAAGLERIMANAAEDSANSVETFDARASSLPEDANSAWFTDATLISTPAMAGGRMASEEQKLSLEDELAESDDAVGEMPLFTSLTIGITAGGSFNEEWTNDDVYQFILLETADPTDADHAVEVIQWRVENMASAYNGMPYSDMLPEFTAEVNDQGLVYCRAAMTAGGPTLVRMLQNRDVVPFLMPV